jgi:hypothetical protein
MSNLHAAIAETNDGEYISSIIGDSQCIHRNEKKLPNKFRHMTAIIPQETQVTSCASNQSNIN